MESRQTRDPGEGIELNVALDTVCSIILMAREFDVKAASTDPSASALDDEDVDAAVLEDRPSDPVAKELTHVIHDLPVDAQIDLVALMWLGREDGNGPEDWPDLRKTAAEEHNSRTARYLRGTPLLSDHLEAGLDPLGLSCAEFYETSV